METQLRTLKISPSLKQKLLLLLFSFILITPSQALINSYTFSPSTQTIDPMTTGTISTLIAAGQDDAASAITAIGFNFVFNGTTYTGFSVSSNGLMRFGTTVVSSTDGNAVNANSLIGTTISNFPRIAPYYDNLRTTTTTGSIRTKVNGTTPNRVRVVDFLCTVVSNSVAAHFQIWLYETSNNIEFVYAAIAANNSNFTIGLASSTTANDMASATLNATFNSSTNSFTTANNSNTLAIPANSSFKYAIAPGCTGSPSPAASATNVSLTPTLSWAAGTGFNNGYDVYFGTAASPPRVSYKQAGTTYAPATLLPNTNYFWKVVARNDSAQAASCSTLSFTTLAAPGCTGSPSPAASATNVATATTLSWAAGSGTTTGYDVYFGTAASPPLVSANQAGTTYNPGTLNIATTYFWKIVPQNSGQLATGCAVIQFTTVVAPGCATGLSPAASATGVSPTATLSWSAGSGTTTGYDVYFGTAASPPIVSTGQPGTTYNPGTLLNGTIYFWKIQPRNGTAIASCSVQQFTTAVAPGCVNVVSPIAAATNVSITPTLSWTAGTGTTTGYDVYFGTAANPPIVSTNQAGTTYAPSTLLVGTVYNWKIVPNNNGAQASGCSTISFTTVAVPGCTTSPSPAASATGVSPVGTSISWVAGSGTTTGYDVYFGTAASPPLVSSNQVGTTYSPGTLLNGTVYFWKINSRNGGAVASCTVIQFTTAVAPGCPAIVSPAAAATNVILSATINWSAGSGTTTGYDVYFGTASNPPLVSPNQPGTTYVPTLNAGTLYYWKIIPINNGASPASCTINQFTTVAAPGCTGTPSPAASAINVAPTATLSWVAGSGTTTGYDVYFGTAANPPLVSPNQAAITYNPGTLLIGTTYFWKIYPINSGVTNSTCPTIQFTTVVTPGCATNLSPASNATGVAPTAQLTWSAGSGTTTGYDVYFGTAASPPIVSTNQAGTSFNPGAMLAGTVYFWKVQPRNGAAIASCSTQQFTIAVAPGCVVSPSPAASATNVSLTPTLSWAASGTTTGYDVYFGTNANPPLVSTNQAGTTYTPSTLLVNTVYNWKVVPNNNGAQATGCTPISFTTVAIPGCTASPSPAASATGVSPVGTSLSWVVGSGTTTGYDVYFGTNASPPLVSSNQAGSSYSLGTLLNGTVYFWKVNPRNGGAVASCSTIQFTTAVAPGCPGSLSPANAATNVSLNPTISWAAGSGTTTGYDVYFGTTSSPPLVVTNQAGTTYLPSLNAGTVYYWKIIPRNNGASPASCSTQSFTTIAAPGCAGSLVPANLATNLSTTTTLSWAAGSGTTNGYDVYFGTAVNPPQVSTNQAGTTYNPGTLAIATDYYWKVIPRNNGGAFASGCSINQFTTTAPPECVINQLPDDLDNDILTTQTLSWDPGTGVTTGYDVYFGTTSNPPLKTTNQVATTYNPGTLLISTTYYWKVIPRNNSLLNTSCPVTQFATIAPPGCISSQSPDNGVTGVSLTPTLSWAPDGGTTTGYDVYFGTATNPPLVSTDQVETTYTTPTLNSSTVYYWKIVPRNNIALSVNCPINSFTTAVPPGCVTNASPASSATNVSVTPTLSWSAGSGTTTGYDVYFGTSSSPPLVSSNQPGTNYIPPTLNINTVYRWKVIPQNLGAVNNSCPVIQFTSVAPPGCVTNLSPAASATGVSPVGPTLSWTAGSGSTTGYDVYFGTSSNPPLVSSNQVGTTYSPGALSNGTIYYWKVNPINGPATASCSTVQFTTAVAPGCTGSPSPAAAATNVATTATLSWAVGSGTTTGYDVYFGQSSNPPKVSSNQPAATYNPGTMNASSTYYWKIAPINNGAANTGCTVNQFSTAVGTSCANSVQPANLSTNLPLQTTLSWSAGPGNAPTGYDIYFGTSASPPLIISNQVATNYTPSFLNFNTTYYWKAVPRTGATPATGCPTYQFATGSPIKYDVTRSTGISFNSISSSGSTVPEASWRNGTNVDDNLSSPLSIGFNFGYGGNTYSQFLVSTNGFITLNNTTAVIGNDASPYGYDNIALSAATAVPASTLLLGPFYDDIVCQGGNPGVIGQLNTAIRYSTSGSVGSRVLTVEWVGMETFGNEGPNLNFQVKLYEGSNNIDFVYGTMEGFNGTFNQSYSYSVGMTGPNISTIPRKGEVINQITADTRNFDSTVAVQMILVPACNTLLHFTPGNYTPYVPPASLVPVNDNPAGAITLNVNSSPCVSLCGTYYSSANATATPSIQLCGVGASTPDDDVWFDFYAVNANTTITVMGGGNYAPVVQLFDNSMNSLGCANAATSPPGLFGRSQVLNMSTLTPGNHYYIRVYHKGSNWGGSNSPGQFAICVSGVPIPPTNDECATNILLPSNGAFITGSSTVAGSASSGIPNCSVSGANPDDDVWYKFVALKAIEVVTVNANSGFNPVIQLFSGTCGALNPISCVNNFGNGQGETLTASGLTVGATYYVRVFHYGSGGGSGSYSINYNSPPPPCETLMLPPDASADMLTEGFDLLWDKVLGADNYKVLLDTVNPPVKQLTLTTDTTVNTGQLLASKTYYWRVVPGNGTSYTTTCPISSFLTEARPIALNVRVFLEGLYVGNSLMKSLSVPADTLSDTITVRLFDTQADNELYSDDNLLVSTSGWVTAHFPIQTLESDYYIVINHKNHLETWSVLFTFNTSDTTYDFTTSNTKAYNNYEIQVSPGVYAIYYGDFNQDDFIDYLDLDIVGAQAAIFATGANLREDMNNDLYVESADYSIFENRAAMLLNRQWPWHP